MALAADSAVLDRDEKGNPRALRLFAWLVEAESLYCAASASRPAENDLVRSFRGGATPDVRIVDFLELIQRYLHCEGSIYVLAAAHLTRFMRSRASREAGIRIEPSTAHRLVSVALLVAGKFASAPYLPNSQKVLPVCSRQSIRPAEFAALERSFLRAIDYRLFVTDEEFLKFCGRLEDAPRRTKKRKAAPVEEPRRVRASPGVTAS
ncbi:hypothetical protein QYE76_041301 [Lolium multiflorum]|uniref:Uncharacterized protein n=1 Tax=Lolium multiflorum TaxID=4521 RepID=A0AAD8TF12_LOLMU|nr:hypothetical protein QYE76_041301 [Lolium multiflorum]